MVRRTSPNRATSRSCSPLPAWRERGEGLWDVAPAPCASRGVNNYLRRAKSSIVWRIEESPMFSYADPAGRNFLNNAAAADNFRRQLSAMYDSFARRVNSGFTWLEAMQNLTSGQPPALDSVKWFAFPLTAQATDKEIDRDRF